MGRIDLEDQTIFVVDVAGPDLNKLLPISVISISLWIPILYLLERIPDYGHAVIAMCILVLDLLSQ